MHPRVLEKATPENVSISISLGKQRAFFFVGEEIAIDHPHLLGQARRHDPEGAPSRSARRTRITARASMATLSAPASGKVVRSGVSTKIDSAPSGTVYRGAPMRWFMRLTNEGVGMHRHPARLSGLPWLHPPAG